MCSNISYIYINLDSALRENTVLIVIYCLSKYQLEAEPSFIGKKTHKNFDKLIDLCVTPKSKYKEIQILQRKKDTCKF